MKIFHAAILFALPWVCAGHASAQAYPSKPIRLIVPFPAASVPDIIVRTMMEKTAPQLGQPAVVENRVGAGGRIGVAALAKSPADGYTLGLGSTSTHMVAPYIVKSMPYDSFQDFTPIVNTSSSSTGVVVNAGLPVSSIKELVEYARKNPSKIAFGSNGIGSTHHLRGELIKMAAGIEMIHVPFGGSNELVTAVLSGTVPLTFITPGTVRPLIQAGKIRHIAMATPKRVPSMPNIPVITEDLPGYEPIVDWFAIFGPGNLPRPIVNRLNSEMVKALQLPEVRATLEGQSLLVIASTPVELAQQMKNDYPIYARVVKAAGVPQE